MTLNRHRSIVHLITEPKVDRIEPICQILANYIGVSKASVQSCEIITKLLAPLGLTLIKSAAASFISLSLDKVDLGLLSCKTKSALEPHIGVIDIGGRNTSSGLNGGGGISGGVATSSTEGSIDIQTCGLITLTNRVRVIVSLLILVELHLTLPCKFCSLLLILILLLEQLLILLVGNVSQGEIHGRITYRIHVGCVLIQVSHREKIL